MNQPRDTAFQQQKLPAFNPIYSPNNVLVCLTVVALFSLTIGGALMVSSDRITEIKQRYDNIVTCDYEAERANGCETVVEVKVGKRMKPPIYLYYQLTNFHQNHRRYSRSRSATMLRTGEVASDSELKDCEPFAKASNGLVYHPCGLIAWSFFNDTFALRQYGQTICDGTLFDESNMPPPNTNNSCTKKGIAWENMLEDKFSPVVDSPKILTYKGKSDSNAERFMRYGEYENEEYHKIPNPVDEDFIVWSRDEALTTFRKIYRRIEVPLDAGLYEMVITQRYPVSSFGGTKSFILLAPNWLGGKSYVLAGFYLFMGSICFIFAVTFSIKVYFPKARLSP